MLHSCKRAQFHYNYRLFKKYWSMHFQCPIIFFFRNANYKLSPFHSKLFTHTKGNQDFRFIFRVDWMQGRGCAHQYNYMLDKFNQNWNAATFPHKTVQYKISRRSANRWTKRLHHTSTIMLTGLKTVVPIARKIFSYQRTEIIGTLISFLKHCCILAPGSTLKGLVK